MDERRTPGMHTAAAAADNDVDCSEIRTYLVHTCVYFLFDHFADKCSVCLVLSLVVLCPCCLRAVCVLSSCCLRPLLSLLCVPPT